MLLFLEVNEHYYIRKNEYGTNQLFQVLDGKQLEYMFRLAEESLKMTVWKHSAKCYLRINDTTVTDYAVDKYKTDGDIEVINLTKYMPYILDLTIYKYDVEMSK